MLLGGGLLVRGGAFNARGMHLPALITLQDASWGLRGLSRLTLGNSILLEDLGGKFAFYSTAVTRELV